MRPDAFRIEEKAQITFKRGEDMRLQYLALLSLLTASAGVVGADDVKPGPASSVARVAWLKQHVAPIRSLDPADENFTDLEPLRKAVGAARIVFLSEEWHGSGATFRVRDRVIRFLHQKCGFDVLAFESGLYDCRKAWQLLKEGKMPALEASSQGIFQTWTGTEECRPLFEYLGKQARQPRPLEVCGFDCQFTGPASRRFLPEELTTLLKKLPPDGLKPEQRDTVVRAFAKLTVAGTGIGKPEKEALAACRKALMGAKPSEDLPAGELAFWRQFLESSLAMAEAEAAQKAGIKTEGNYMMRRDEQMARNLVWLAHEAYPKRKIIVWAAAFHLMRNPETVAMISEPGKTAALSKSVPSYPRNMIRTMGNEAWKAIEKETYSIFFTAAEGEFQAIAMAKPEKLKPLIQDSLEDLLVKAGVENGFFDLRRRGKDGSWLEERLIARVMGDMDYEADWTKVCDGIFFLKKQHGVTPVKIDLSAVKYLPQKDATALDVPFDRYTTRDKFNRTITFYLSQPPKGVAEKLPVAVFVQGSGCASVFSKQDGKVYGGMQNLLDAAGKGRVRVLVVEKPGVTFGEFPKSPGSAEEGSTEFRREHTLPRWVEAVNAAVVATHRLEDVDWTRTLVVGHSEGGIVAAHVAAANRLISHVVVLSGSGPTQLFDLIELASHPQPADRSPDDAQGRAQAVRDGWAKVLADPERADKFWLGHPYRRWSSFLKSSTVEGLLATRASVFAAHGTLDRAVPVASFDVLRAELAGRGRDLIALRLEGRDHGFRKPDDAPGDVSGLEDVFGRVVAWFQEKRSPVELTIRRDVDQMQGTWQAVLMNREGEIQPLQGAFANLQLIVKNDRRTIRSGETIFSEAYYRLNPAAEPPTIDLVVTKGGARGQIMLGIYGISGDRLRVCYAGPGRERPRDFTPKAGSGHALQEMKRAPS
jgi:erythromycin esterase